MAVVGFNFTNIIAEKKQVSKGKIRISNNVAIEKVEKSTFSIGQDTQDTLKFTIKFVSKFEPDVGAIELIGNLVVIEAKEQVQEIEEMWKKGKKLPKEVMTEVLNVVLARCNTQALILSRDINLPSPIPLPKVKIKNA